MDSSSTSNSCSILFLALAPAVFYIWSQTHTIVESPSSWPSICPPWLFENSFKILHLETTGRCVIWIIQIQKNLDRNQNSFYIYILKLQENEKLVGMGWSLKIRGWPFFQTIMMEEKFDIWIFRFVLLYALCIFVFTRSSSASEG